MINAKTCYVTMMEVMRRSSEPGALDQANKVNFQRQRSNSTAWLDWACDAKRYMDDLSEPQQVAMEVVYWSNERIPDKAQQLILIADEGLEKWFNSLPDEVKKQGEKIAGRL
jgi:hypothetical protein